GAPAPHHPEDAGPVRRRAERGQGALMSLPDLQGLLDAARRIQDEVARVREQLGEKTVTGETGGGLVRCVANGTADIVSITVDPSVFSSGDKRMLEDLTVGAVNLALERAR